MLAIGAVLETRHQLDRPPAARASVLRRGVPATGGMPTSRMLRWGVGGPALRPDAGGQVGRPAGSASCWVVLQARLLLATDLKVIARRRTFHRSYSSKAMSDQHFLYDGATL